MKFFLLFILFLNHLNYVCISVHPHDNYPRTKLKTLGFNRKFDALKNVILYYISLQEDQEILYCKRIIFNYN